MRGYRERDKTSNGNIYPSYFLYIMLLFLIQETKRRCHTTWRPVAPKTNASFGCHSNLFSLFCSIALYTFKKHFILLVLSTTKLDVFPKVGNWDLLWEGSRSAVEIVTEDGAACLRLSSPRSLPRCSTGGLRNAQHGSSPHSLTSWDLFHPTLFLSLLG